MVILGIKRDWRRDVKMAEIAAEFGEPFLDVVRGFAAAGHSRSDTAAILEVNRDTFFRWIKALSAAGIDFPWPAKGYSVAFKQAVPLRLTPRFYEAARANCALAREATLRRWEKEKKATPEAARRAEQMHSNGMTYREIAKHLGMDLTTLSRARKQYGS